MKFYYIPNEMLMPLFDANLTEVANMRNNGYLRIFDCGNLKLQK